MGFEVQFQAPALEVIIETDTMQEVASRTLAVHPVGGLVVWYGRARIGKTTTARWLVDVIDKAYHPEKLGAFHAKHYEVGQIPRWSGQEMKKGLRSLYHAVIGPLDEGVYRQFPSEDLAIQIVHALRRKNIQLILVDEAGCLALEAIRAFVLVSDKAKEENWSLLIVLIGMDNLPEKVTRLEQVEGRIQEWCYFEPYSLDESWKLLSALHPYFAQLDGKKEADRAQVEFIHNQFGGIPGLIVPFLYRFTSKLDLLPGEDPMLLLRAVHLQTVRDRNRMLNDTKGGYKKSDQKRESTDEGKKGDKNNSNPKMKAGKMGNNQNSNSRKDKAVAKKKAPKEGPLSKELAI